MEGKPLNPASKEDIDTLNRLNETVNLHHRRLALYIRGSLTETFTVEEMMNEFNLLLESVYRLQAYLDAVAIRTGFYSKEENHAP